MASRAQLQLDLTAPKSPVRLPAPAQRLAEPPTPAEKVATRAAQVERCKTCGQPSPRRALDVVRRDGVLVALCRRDRLRWDAPWRCAKAVGKRRRGLNTKRARRRRRARTP